MKNKINIKKWKEYNLKNDLNFEIYHGQRLTKAARIEGDIPLLTAGKINQGVGSYIGNPLCIYKDSITVDMFGNCFYHKGKYSGDDNIYFYINGSISEKSKLYIVSILSKKLFNSYSYIDQFRQDDADNLSVYLPTTSSGSPDWEYMECYIEKIKQEMEKFISNLNKTKDINNSKIDTQTWKEFEIGELFEIKSPKVYHTREVKEDSNGIPYVVRSKYNNGVKYYVRNEENFILNPSNVISFGAENASFFYQERPYISGRDMYYIDTRNLSRNTVLFIIACLEKLTSKYSYNFGLFPKLLKEEKIKLPITNNGEPDYEYMDKYMSGLLNRAKNKLSYLNVI